MPHLHGSHHQSASHTYSPRPLGSSLPSIPNTGHSTRMAKVDGGHAVVAFSIIFFIIASYAVFFSAFIPETGISVLNMLAEDTHYKYFTILIIPTTFYFVIANWVGWQYYSNS